MARSTALFLLWALTGFVMSFALLYGFTPVGPLFILVGWLAYRYVPLIGGRRTPEAFGVVAGFGGFWLFVATTLDGAAPLAASIGAAAAAASIVAYIVSGRRRCGTQATPG